MRIWTPGQEIEAGPSFLNLWDKDAVFLNRERPRTFSGLGQGRELRFPEVGD